MFELIKEAPVSYGAGWIMISEFIALVMAEYTGGSLFVWWCGLCVIGACLLLMILALA